MNIKLELPQLTDLKPRLTVIGIGGAGCNAINNMISAGLTGVEFVAANTDAQTLDVSSAEHRIQLGTNLTEGLGAGANPEIGAAAAEEALDEIKSQISGSHMVFLAAGMGGGTGTGAIPIIARASREMGILTVGVVTKPFQFEGSRRMRIAEAGIEELRQHVDTMIAIPNQNLFRVANDKTTFAEAFLLADQVLYSGVACIVDLIVREGLINLDFADVRAVMRNMGSAMMGTGEGTGEKRAIAAAEEAIANPLLDDVSLQGAKGLLLSITGGADLTLYEVDEAASRVRKEVDPEANIIVGATFDDTMQDRIRVSIVASGMSEWPQQSITPAGSSGLQGLDEIRNTARAAPYSTDLPAPPPMPASKSGNANGEHQGNRDAFPHHQPVVDERNRQQSTRQAVPDNNSALWRSPEGVTIEAGTSAYRQTSPKTPAPRPEQAEATFHPRQTDEIHRRNRRMPEVEDFPVVGQRDYYAKRNDQLSGEAAKDSSKPTKERQGLFGLFSKRDQKPGDSPEKQDMHKKHNVTQRTSHGEAGHSGAPATATDQNRDGNSQGVQGAESSMFFSGSRGRR